MKVVLAAATATLAMIAAGCGDDGATPTPATIDAVGSTTTAPTVTTAEATTIPTTTGADPGDDSTTTPQSSWQRGEPMPVPRSELAAISVDGLVYVPGGFHRTAEGEFEGHDVVEVYDAATDSWSRAPDLPAPRHHLMGTAQGGRVFVMGGFDDDGHTDTVWSLGPEESEWQEHAPMPVDVAAGAAASLDGHIYVIGGLPDGDVVLRYDPAADRWEQLEPLGTRREHLAAVAHDGRIWAIGGRWETDHWDSVEILDPATGSWSPGPSLNSAHSGFGAAVWEGTIALAGGELIDTREALTTFEVLEDGMWVEGEPLPIPLHGHAMVVVGDRLMVVGGSRVAADVVNHGDILLRGLEG